MALLTSSFARRVLDLTKFRAFTIVKSVGLCKKKPGDPAVVIKSIYRFSIKIVEDLTQNFWEKSLPSWLSMTSLGVGT